MKSNERLVIKKERRFKLSLSFRTFCYILLYLCVLIFIWYIITYKYIKVYLVEPNTKNEGYFYSVLNSLMLLIFLIACGFTFNMSSKKFKLIIFFVILFLILEGWTTVGIGIRFRENYGLLIHDTYESNSKEGIEFFIFNFFVFWIYVFIISLFFESEKE